VGSVVPTGLGSFLFTYTQDLRPGLISATPTGRFFGRLHLPKFHLDSSHAYNQNCVLWQRGCAAPPKIGVVRHRGLWEICHMGRGGNGGVGAGGRVPGGRDNTKHRGAMAEMQFMLDAAKRGFGVAKPFGDNERYDVILDAARRLWRVQVKASGARHHKGFAVRACWRTSKRHMPYTKDQIDFLAVVIQGWHPSTGSGQVPSTGSGRVFWQTMGEVGHPRGKRIWYVIPVEALGGRLTINLYPFGCRKDGEERFEEYRGAWRLLECE